jgi:mRNA interferase HigB
MGFIGGDLAESPQGQQGQKAVKAALDAWFREVHLAEWRSSADVKRNYGAASIVSSDRVVFNIKGNDYRMVTAIDDRRFGFGLSNKDSTRAR